MTTIIYLLFNVYAIGLLVYIVCSWVTHPKATDIKHWLQKWYEPLLKPIQSIVPSVKIGTNSIDLSPALLLLAILLLRSLVVSLFTLP